MKAIFLDIDGTLVSFKTHTIPQSTVDAVIQAKANGHKVFIATGRSKAIINNIESIEEYIDGYVTMNGSYCYVGSEVLHKSIIPRNEVRALADYCKKLQKATIFVSEHKLGVVGTNALVSKLFYEHLDIPVIPSTTFEEAVEDEILQITPFFTVEEEQNLIQDMPNSQPERWHPEFVDIVAKGNTKETGIQVIQKHFNLKREDTIAIGDGGNDITMLKYAGIGIAMGNAADTVKQHADYVTTSVDEDGVYNALKKFNLI